MPDRDGSTACSQRARLAIILLLPLASACGQDIFDANRVANCAPGQCPRLECTADGSWPANWAALEEQALAIVNQQRASGASCGGDAYRPAQALSMNSELREAARCHSLDMATQNYFAHESLDGRSPWGRIAAAGYRGSPAGENIAAGYPDARAVVNGLMGSPGHCRNIMQASSNEVGIGFANSSTGAYHSYWTQDFGRR